MRAWPHRFASVAFAFGLAVASAGACGGAESSLLDTPAPAEDSGGGKGGSSGSGSGGRDANGGSSSGSSDATVSDATSVGDDLVMDSAPVGNDGDLPPVDAGPDGPPDASLCGPCAFGDRCCTTRGTLSYGQCYSVLCGACCP